VNVRQWNGRYISAVGNADTQNLTSRNTGTGLASYWLINEKVVKVKLLVLKHYLINMK
jgi:hypothetical protein